MDEMGGSMLLYRQFVERNDFELFVITDRSDFDVSPLSHLILETPPILSRFMRTRFALYAHDFQHLFRGRLISKKVRQIIDSFQPDIIVTGAETWLGDLGITISQKYHLPLASYFMDWPVYGMLGHDLIKRWASRQFRQRYQKADLAFGICPEMLFELGSHKNAHVFYPMGSRDLPRFVCEHSSKDHPFTLLFAGNLGQWYGPMLAELAEAFESECAVRLRIAGKNENWSSETKDQLTQSGVFIGFLKGDDYDKVLETADALLVVMGFDEDSRIVESTSFKSKLSDYLSMGVPLIVWGPNYCTANQHARMEGFAKVVEERVCARVVEATKELANSAAERQRIVERGREFYQLNLAPDLVLRSAQKQIYKLLDDRN